MKKNLLLVAFFLPLASSAQSIDNDGKQQGLLGAGKTNLGVGIARSYGGNSISFATQLTPRLQYFIKDGWSVAVEGELSRNYGTQNKFNAAGLTTRYYFLRSHRLALFGEAGASFGRATISVDASDTYGMGARIVEKATRFQTKVGLGVHYRLSDRWSLEGNATHNSGSRGMADTDFGRWRTGIGVNFRLK